VASSTPVRARMDSGTLLFALVCCIPLLCFTVYVLGFVPLAYFDFVSYWSAGRLVLAHQNPYVPASMFALERAQGWNYWFPLVMLCPPWTLFVNALFGILPFREAQLGWYLVSLSLDGLSAIGLWYYFGGKMRSLWIAFLVFLSFTPLVTVAHVGQVTPIMLACLTAFLLLVRSERWVLAGMSLLGMSIKPHLLWLVFIAIFLWAIRNRKVKFLVAGFVTWMVAWAANLAFDPEAIHFFHNAYGPAIATSCGFGGALRLLFGKQHAWLQYTPCVAGAVWFAWYWAKNRRNWSWTEHMPLLLIVSVASSPYCWFHDFILVLPAFIALATRGAYRSLITPALWLGIQVAILLAPQEAYKAAVSALWVVFWILATRNRTVLELANGNWTPAPVEPTAQHA